MAASKLSTFHEFYTLLNSLITAIRYGFRCQPRKTLSSPYVPVVQWSISNRKLWERYGRVRLAISVPAETNLCSVWLSIGLHLWTGRTETSVASAGNAYSALKDSTAYGHPNDFRCINHLGSAALPVGRRISLKARASVYASHIDISWCSPTLQHATSLFTPLSLALSYRLLLRISSSCRSC